jgi:hypothetical protein
MLVTFSFFNIGKCLLTMTMDNKIEITQPIFILATVFLQRKTFSIESQKYDL